jgi:DNA-binding response OmpR family regulator
MKVLIAEDDFTSRVILEAELKKMGFEVVVANDGTQALAVLQKKEAPSLVILDWMMPGFTGLEICLKLRNDPNLEQKVKPYVIILTAKSRKEDSIQILDAGADDILHKPFDLGELKARILVGNRLVEMQKELVFQKEQAIQSNEAKSEFLANMSHEIRTPMNGVLGMTNLLLESELGSDQIDLAEGLKESAESLLVFINDILDLSKITAGKMILEKVDFD